MGFVEHFSGVKNVAIECDYSGEGYNSFTIDGTKYDAYYPGYHEWDTNEYKLFDHSYNSMLLYGYTVDGAFHEFRVTLNIDKGKSHNKVISCVENA